MDETVHDVSDELPEAVNREAEIRVGVDVGDVKGRHKQPGADCVAPAGEGLVVVLEAHPGSFPFTPQGSRRNSSVSSTLQLSYSSSGSRGPSPATQCTTGRMKEVEVDVQDSVHLGDATAVLKRSAWGA